MRIWKNLQGHENYRAVPGYDEEKEERNKRMAERAVGGGGKGNDKWHWVERDKERQAEKTKGFLDGWWGQCKL